MTISRLEFTQVQKISEGIYTMWKVRKPSIINKFINYFSSNISILDVELTVTTETMVADVTIYEDVVTLHSLTDEQKNRSISVNKDIPLESSRKEFNKEFCRCWVNSMDELKNRKVISEYNQQNNSE